jgi:hypothetical protein
VSDGGTLGLYVLYECGDATSPTTQITPHFEIGNNSTVAESLAGVTIRYYFTSDGGASPIFQCNFANLGAGVGCSTLSGTFASWAGTMSDHYLEVAFTSGTVGPGGTIGPIQVQIHDMSFSTEVQTNDYSFNSSDTKSYTAWDHVTLYKNGTKYWGFEP